MGFAASSILTIPTSQKQFHEGKMCIFPANAFANDYATKRKNAQSICQVRVKCLALARAIVVTKDQSGDRKTISRPVSATESKLAQIRNANQ